MFQENRAPVAKTEITQSTVILWKPFRTRIRSATLLNAPTTMSMCIPAESEREINRMEQDTRTMDIVVIETRNNIVVSSKTEYTIGL